MHTNEIRPYESDTDHCEKPCDSLGVAQMRVLDVESGGFHSPECGFDLPSPFVSGCPLFGTVEADEDLKFRHAVRVLDVASGKINVFTLVKEKLVISSFLTHLQGIKEPPCTDSLSGGGLDNPEVLTDLNIIPYMVAVEPINPILANELPVSDNTVNVSGTEQPDKAFHNGLAFLPVGIPFLRQRLNINGKAIPL